MRWSQGPQERRLEPGDEARPWKTFQELINAHGITRGALDRLVLEHHVPFVNGATLVEFLVAPERLAEARQMDLANEAARRLAGTRWVPAMNELALVEAEAKLRGLDRKQVYYDVSAFFAEDAAARLGAPHQRTSAEVLGGGRGMRPAPVRLTQELVRCPDCGAEVPAEQVGSWQDKDSGERTGSCPVCRAEAMRQKELTREYSELKKALKPRGLRLLRDVFDAWSVAKRDEALRWALRPFKPRPEPIELMFARGEVEPP